MTVIEEMDKRQLDQKVGFIFLLSYQKIKTFYIRVLFSDQEAEEVFCVIFFSQTRISGNQDHKTLSMLPTW